MQQFDRLQNGFILITSILLLLAATLLITTALHNVSLHFRISQQQIMQQTIFATLETGLIKAEQALTIQTPLLENAYVFDENIWQKNGNSIVINNIKMQYVYQLIAERDCVQLNDKNTYVVKNIRIIIRSVEYPELIVSQNYLLPIAAAHHCHHIVRVTKSISGWSTLAPST